MVTQEKEHLLFALSKYNSANTKTKITMISCVKRLIPELESKICDAYYTEWPIKDRLMACKIFLRVIKTRS